MTPEPAKFVWYELMTSDPGAAARFYASVVGWTAADSGMPGPPYTILSAGSTRVGGLLAIPEEVRAAGPRPMWMGYLAVPDVDAHAARVREAGGSVHRPAADIPGVGRFAVVADPHGAAFVLFKGASSEQPAPAEMGAPGHVGWRELHAGNVGEAFAFYSGLFGWTKGEALDMGAMGTYQTFATGGAPVGGMMTKTPDVPRPFWLFYFSVDALDAAVARVESAGGRLLLQPMQVPGGGWIAQGFDPQGAMFALLAAKR